jgi:hydroxymethylpyrimidine pyrophosphatase-like HAD family hydrolase
MCVPQGIISQASLAKAAELRKSGTAVIVISGARTSTVLQRLPYLPAADAIIAENGEQVLSVSLTDARRNIYAATYQQPQWAELHCLIGFPSSGRQLPDT